MEYVGMLTQIRRNNILSFLLLLMFPTIILGLLWVGITLYTSYLVSYYDESGRLVFVYDTSFINYLFTRTAPVVTLIIAIWFVIAYKYNTYIIRRATGAHAIARSENARLYNIVENLTIACGMDMPKINIVDDAQLNAFASGVDRNSYTVTVTSGLLDLLSDEELEGVIAHELTHIRNRDTRLLITSIVFVGIFSTLLNILIHSLLSGGSNGRYTRYEVRDDGDHDNNEKGGGSILFILMAVVLLSIAYFFVLITRFAISRKREYMADAGGAELCGNPLALASALRKISAAPGLGHINREDVSQLFIIRPPAQRKGLLYRFNSLFSTHPDVEQRIAILEQF